MKKIVFYLLIIALLLTGCSKKIEVIEDNNTSNNKEEKTNNNEEINQMKAIIHNKEYIINLENNTTVDALIKLLPLELNMNELNGNEKYVYLDDELPTNTYSPKKINTGDVMLFGNNCLVVFYKSFNTSYTYTKIGHINNLPDLGKDNILIKITN